ncbi:cation:proton antiporter [Stenotrophomonas pictorum]|uniref:cation:proton antiporter n=1 Tax=Stenotrophomonas pictorum TaxID=86184 RepID=UPI000A4D53E4|nr:cation:proton antiporter [Stenotrophomonas pictorum]
MNKDVIYLLLIFALLVIPRAIQRFSIPAPLTCLAFGIGAVLWLDDGAHDPVVSLLSILGISSLFLFAGLEVDIASLRKGLWPLLAHLLIRSASLVGVAWLAWRYAGLSWQAAGLLALALLTPSTGFIMDSLSQLGLGDEERFWVTSKAIAGELLALAAMFVVMQADDPVHLGLSSLALVAMMVGLPLLFVGLGRWVAPHAPGSEFSLLVMVGMLAAYITYWLGVYYLVGAFIAGLVARLLQQRMPSLASHENLHALRLFSSFFVPFYFFNSGTHVPGDALSFEALGLGVVITLVVLPLRIAVVSLQRRLIFGESLRSSLRVALALSPTLIFTLVLAGIMRERFDVSPVLYGALLFYAAVTTLLPSLVFRTPMDVDPLQHERAMDAAATNVRAQLTADGPLDVASKPADLSRKT